MAYAGRIEALVVVPSAQSFSATNNGGTSTVNLTAGEYFPTAFCSHLQTRLNTDRPGSGGALWSVALDTTTGKVTIAMSTSTLTLASFSGTNLATLLGFTSNPTAVASVIGANQMRGVFIPDRPLVVDGSDPNMAPLKTDLKQSRTSQGRVIGIGGGNAFHVHRRAYYEHVEKARVWDYAATTVNGTWETFVRDVQLGRGHAWFRPSSLVQIYDTANVKVGIAANSGAGVAGWYMEGLDGIEPKRSIDHWTGAYTIEIPRLVAEVP